MLSLPVVINIGQVIHTYKKHKCKKKMNVVRKSAAHLAYGKEYVYVFRNSGDDKDI